MSSESKQPDKKKVQLPQSKNSRNGAGSGKGKPQAQPPRTILVWVLIITTVLLGLQFIKKNVGPARQAVITYSQFQELVKSNPGQIEKLTVVQQGLSRAVAEGAVKSEDVLSRLTHQEGAVTNRFTVNLPFVDSPMLQRWDEAGIRYTFEAKQWDVWDVVFSLAPWLIIILIWMFMIRQMQAGQKNIFSFGKSRAKLNPLDRPQNTFADVAGVEEAKVELQEIIEFLKDPGKFKKLGGKIPKGVLLLGSPGTGKTLLARCVAGEAGVPFLSMSGSDFVEMFVGVGASRVRDLFETAKRNAPCIIFIDEIDAVGRQRGAGLGGGHDEREQTLNQMLVEMDGFEVNAGIILIAATNRPDVLDPALLRPGRFDRQIVVDVPDVNGRRGILDVHTKSIPLADDVMLDTIARGTPGFVGADLANLVNEAALLAARFGQEKVTMLDFEEAKDKVFMGVERKSLVLSDTEKRNTAFHEAGHAICTVYCNHGDPLHKVTIIPRGRALGVTWSLPKEDKYSQSSEYILDKVCMSMGGRAAEQLAFGQKTTGAAQDIKEATRLVRRLICDFGMSDELGPVAYGEHSEQVFLGRELNQHRDYSEKTAEEIDGLIRRTIEEQYTRAMNILVEHRDELDRLAEALVEHELLDAEEVQKVIKGEHLATVKKTRILPRPVKKVEPELQEVGVESGVEGAEKLQEIPATLSSPAPALDEGKSGESAT